MQVARALAFGESVAMRGYCRVGRTLLTPAGSGWVFDEALVIVSDRRKLAEFENHLLKTPKAPVTADVA